ncbi:hypothetical protein PFHG_02533 [Plasmodium falciparum HB3]|uniref:MACPF domain-containing protein n=1 Tax=Plasmodium falciparum (isolate HB3) TaxID=137071 RepID=A0A0L7KCJ0_PLAFX|nr:hypothetical protein PFHG_02533 [Plasmodium falciparum HB3]
MGSFSICHDIKTDEKTNEIFSKYLGKGYDILFGYPLPNNELIDDPGFKEVIIDTQLSIDNISNYICKKEEYVDVIEDINDIGYLGMQKINIDDLDNRIKPFSASMPYKSYFADLEIKKKKYALAQNMCVLNYATYDLKESGNNINKDFVLDIEKLPILTKNQMKLCTKVLYMNNNLHCSEDLSINVDGHKENKKNNSNNNINIDEKKKNDAYIKNDVLIEQYRDNINLEIRGGNNFDEKWRNLTYLVWKNSIYSNIVPIHLDLYSLNTFMPIEKKESYDMALLFYNNLYGIDNENFYLSQDITDVLSEGKQITGSNKGSLILSCPVGYIKSTGLIFVYDSSEKLKTNKSKDPKIKIYPCTNKGQYDIACSYITKKKNIITFGWIYCVKHNFIKFETLYQNNDNIISKDGKTFMSLTCTEGNTIAFGFKMKLKKLEKLEKLKIKPCTIGDDQCTINNIKRNSDYLLWGFCVPSSFRSLSSLQLTYIHDDTIQNDIRGACSDIYINKYDNIFLGFTFSFDNKFEQTLLKFSTYTYFYLISYYHFFY